MLPGGAGLTKLEPRRKALKADQSGNLPLTVLTYGLHRSWDVVDHWRRAGTSPLCLHVIHDGDIGYMGVCRNKGTLWAGERFVAG